MRRYGLDLMIGILAVGAMVEVAVGRASPAAPRTSPWFDVAAIAVLVLPLFVRRRFPFGAPTAYWLLGAALSFVDGRLVTFPVGIFVTGMMASFLLGDLRDGLKARMGLGVVLAGAEIVIFNKPEHSAGELVFIPLVFGVCWLGGYAVRERAGQVEVAEARATQAEREREAAARIAVAEERVRIARELHDIVAHALSVMVLQVGAVRHKLPGGLDEDRNALLGVEHAGRLALAEMRHLLGAMREDGEDVQFAPQPGLDRIDALVQEVDRAGLPVGLRIEGDRVPLPRGIDISAYRIVQEGLTNALRHAHASHADVTLHYAPDELRIEVRDNGQGASSGNGLGHGLVGIRERVKLYGGEVTTGTATGGGFVLSTCLPLGQYRS